MITILIGWVLFFIIILGFGLATLKIMSRFIKDVHSDFDLFRSFWLGFVVLIGFLEFYSLFFPINTNALFIILGISFVSYAANRKRLPVFIQRIKGTNRTFFSYLTQLILISSILLLVLFLAAHKVKQWDAFEYHYQTVRWMNEYPAVPGLIQVSFRMAFNSSFFLFAAANNLWFLKGLGAHTALSLIVAVITVQWVLTLCDKRTETIERIFIATTIPFILYKIFLTGRVASLSTDLSTFVICLIFSLELLKKDKSRLIMIAGLSACLFSFKLSGLSGIAMFFFVIFICYHKQFFHKSSIIRAEKMTILFSCLLFTFIIIGFFVRNAIISGWIAYPIPISILNLNFPWSVPSEEVAAASDLIKGWARTPGNAIRGLELGFWKWIVLWLSSWKNIHEIPLFVVSLVFLLLSFALHKTRRIMNQSKEQFYSIQIFSLFSLIIWFYGAPSMRFGTIFFWVFFAASILPFIELFLTPTQKKTIFIISFSIGLTLFFLIFNHKYLRYLDNESSLFLDTTKLSYRTFPPLKKFILNETGSSFVIYEPTTKYKLCGYSPIPCVRNVEFLKKNKIKQRVPGKMSSGFIRENLFSAELDKFRMQKAQLDKKNKTR